MPLHKNVRRCSFVKIHKPGDLLKESKLLPMKARLHTQRNDILLHTEYEGKILCCHIYGKEFRWQRM